jgi:hypothetical protein
MIGFLMLFASVGFFAFLGTYMSSLGAFFVALAGGMGIYMGGLIAYFTAFFIIMFG